MKSDLILSPSGDLRMRAPEGDPPEPPSPWMKRVRAAFSDSRGAGLFALAATIPDEALSPSMGFWRDFAGRYLGRLCRQPETVDDPFASVEPLAEADRASLVLSAPPMEGGEYLSRDVLQDLWDSLSGWVRDAVTESAMDLPAWLKKHAAAWRQVGRVCFHLAENRRDPELPFAFMATYAPDLSSGGRIRYRPLGKALQEYAGAKNRKALVRLLSPVQRASEKVDFVKELVESGDIYHPIAWTPEEAFRLMKSVPLLEESGLLVRLPDWWKKRPRPRVAVTVGGQEQTRLGADAMLDFNVDIVLGDRKLTQKEWKRLMAAEDGLAYIKGQWIEVDRERLGEALDHWQRVRDEVGEDGLSFIDGMRLLAGAPTGLDGDAASEDPEREWSFVNAGTWLSGVLEGLRDPEGLTFDGATNAFRGTLRPYQETGRNWLWLLTNLGLGACLADDMGLGKTVQVLSLLLALKAKEDSRKGSGETRTKVAGKTGAMTAGKGTQNTAKRSATSGGGPDPHKPSLLVLPASLVANWKSEIERFAPSLKAAYIHPSETTREELNALAGKPARLDAYDVVLTTYGMLFRKAWLLDRPWRLAILDEAQAIKNSATRQTRAVKRLKADARIALTGTPVENRLSDLWSLFDFLSPGLLGSAKKFKSFVKGLESGGSDRYAPLRNLVQPYILRRLKTDKRIISDLPDKTEMKTYCGLTKKQAALYARSVEELAKALELAEGIRRRGLVLSFLMRFKQICNHPSQLLGDVDFNPAHSGKYERLRMIGEEIASRQEKALVFTQFREMTEPLADFLGDVFGQEGLVLHGGTPVRKRKTLVARFQEDGGPPFFVISLKAGGTGLNLTAASHVIHFDRWWNPAVENQATDRAFRIGQHRNVVVHKFVCRGTVEERIDAMIDEKTDLADGILKGGAESLLTEMSDKELMNLVALDIDQAGMSVR